MTQKAIFKSGKKKPGKVSAATDKHGKVQKGKFQKAPKSAAAQRALNSDKEVSKVINQRNEGLAAAAAAHNGLRLSMVKPGKEEPSKGGKKVKGQLKQ